MKKKKYKNQLYVPEGTGDLEEIDAQVCAGESEPGSGSAPGEYLPTHVVRVKSGKRSVDELAAELRAGEPPLFTRIHEGALVLDPRTLLPGEGDEVVSAFRDLK